MFDQLTTRYSFVRVAFNTTGEHPVSGFDNNPAQLRSVIIGCTDLINGARCGRTNTNRHTPTSCTLVTRIYL